MEAGERLGMVNKCSNCEKEMVKDKEIAELYICNSSTCRVEMSFVKMQEPNA